MTRDEFIAHNVDQFAGQLLDAALSQRTGADLSVWLRSVAYPQLKARLAAMYDQLHPPAPLNGPTNGKPAARPAQSQPARNGS